MTLYSLVKAIKGLARLQPNISFVHSGDVYELNSNGEVDYPAFVISQNTHREDMYEDAEVYGFNLFAIDRLTSDYSNQLDVQSWANDLLKGMIEQIEELNIGIVVGEAIIQPFTERFESMCAGCYATIQISINNIDCEGDKYLLKILDKINSVVIFKDVYELEGTVPGTLLLYDGDKPIHFGDEQGYLCIELLEGGTITFNDMDLAKAANMEFMVEGDEGFQSIEHLPSYVFDKPTKVYFKGNMTQDTKNRFIFDNGANLSGNIMSLMYGDDFDDNNELQRYVFSFLFSGCGVVDASKLKLPLTTVEGCYDGMFNRCELLTKAPELPAPFVEYSSYTSMFYGCSSLVEAPELPATTLMGYAYSYMFANCNSLVKAPELPATTLGHNCYDSMFAYSTSLKTAPSVIPAEEIPSYCCTNMFGGCTSLETAPELPATTLRQGAYQSMFMDCTNLIKAPSVLPATEWDVYAYYLMFSRCTSLETAPELPAVKQMDEYSSMFSNCTKLKKIKCMTRFDKWGDEIYDRLGLMWLYNASPTGTFYKNPDWDGPYERNFNGIPVGWTIVNWGSKTPTDITVDTDDSREWVIRENNEYRPQGYDIVHYRDKYIYLMKVTWTGANKKLLIDSIPVTDTTLSSQWGLYLSFGEERPNVTLDNLSDFVPIREMDSRKTGLVLHESYPEPGSETNSRWLIYAQRQRPTEIPRVKIWTAME